MAIQIISIKEKKGSYEGRDYHNFNIFGLNPDSDNQQLIAGGEVKDFKIKASDFEAAFKRNVDVLKSSRLKEVKDLIGLYIVPVYNEFGNCQDFTLSIPDKK